MPPQIAKPKTLLNCKRFHLQLNSTLFVYKYKRQFYANCQKSHTLTFLIKCWRVAFLAINGPGRFFRGRRVIHAIWGKFGPNIFGLPNKFNEQSADFDEQA